MKPKIKYSSLLLALLLSVPVFSQDKKMEASVELSYTKKADQSNTASVRVTAKNNEGKRGPAKNATVNFYIQNGTGTTPVGTKSTDVLGKATITLPKDLPSDTGGNFTIVAKIENDKMYSDADDEIHLKKADLTVVLNPKDTGRMAKVKVTTIGKDGEKVPVKDVTVSFYVKRMFGLMPATEDYTATTDENGEATLKYPKTIMGDTLGNITVTAKIADNDQFGNIESSTIAQWGVAVHIDKNPFPRALWEPRAPTVMVITISLLYGGVWFVYFFTFNQLRLIKKGKKLKTQKGDNQVS